MIVTLAAEILALGACGSTGTTETSPAQGTPSAIEATPNKTVVSTAGVPGTIAFTRVTKVRGEYSGDIYAIRTDGTGLRRLAGSDQDERQATWSPDGRSIAYIRHVTAWIMGADGSKQRCLRRTGADADPDWIDAWQVAWSLDGNRVALVRLGGALAVVKANGGEPKDITSGSSPLAWNPAWAPDGRILFTRWHAGSRLSEICAVDPDGGSLKVVATASGPDLPASFSLSPDGKWLAMWDASSDRLLRRPVEGEGAETVLVDDVSRYFPPPAEDGELGIASSWSPDGTAIAFAADEPPARSSRPSAIYIVNADGSGLRKVPNTGKAYNPVWRPE